MTVALASREDAKKCGNGWIEAVDQCRIGTSGAKKKGRGKRATKAEKKVLGANSLLKAGLKAGPARTGAEKEIYDKTTPHQRGELVRTAAEIQQRIGQNKAENIALREHNKAEKQQLKKDLRAINREKKQRLKEDREGSGTSLKSLKREYRASVREQKKRRKRVEKTLGQDVAIQEFEETGRQQKRRRKKEIKQLNRMMKDSGGEGMNGLMVSYGGNVSAQRYDASLQCKQGNQQCGGRCIPADQECHSEGAGGAAKGNRIANRVGNVGRAVHVGGAASAAGAALRYGTKGGTQRLAKDKERAQRLKQKVGQKVEGAQREAGLLHNKAQSAIGKARMKAGQKVEGAQRKAGELHNKAQSAVGKAQVKAGQAVEGAQRKAGQLHNRAQSAAGKAQVAAGKKVEQVRGRVETAVSGVKKRLKKKEEGNEDSLVVSYGGNVSPQRYDSAPQCKQGNQQCGERCIPSDQECHVEGGTGGKKGKKPVLVRGAAGAAFVGAQVGIGGAALRYGTKGGGKRLKKDKQRLRIAKKKAGRKVEAAKVEAGRLHNRAQSKIGEARMKAGQKVEGAQRKVGELHNKAQSMVGRVQKGVDTVRNRPHDPDPEKSSNDREARRKERATKKAVKQVEKQAAKESKAVEKDKKKANKTAQKMWKDSALISYGGNLPRRRAS